MKLQHEITSVQTATILISTIIGVGVLNLPRTVVEAADTGGPFITLIGVIIAFISVMVITKLGLRFPDQSIIDYSEMIVGKWMSRLYGVVLISLFIMLTGITAREFGTVMSTSVLSETPIEVTVIVMLLLAAFFTRNNLTTFAYIHNFYVPAILITGVTITAVSMQHAEPLYLQPVFGSELNSEMFTGILSVAAIFQGAFIITIIIPYMQKPEQAKKAVFWGITTAGCFYIMVVIITLAVFGTEEIKTLFWPTLELARTISLPGNFLQRADVLFLTFWVVTVFTTIFSNYMFLVQALRQFFRLNDHKMLSFFLLPIIFGLSMVPENVLQLYGIVEVVTWFGLAVTILVPLFLLVMVKIQKRGEK
ncbi:spore gernimation protein [Salibacterium salarium]|uniref:Spore gernimation protein n=1 Tax=Salibacterium salarium TaxID=284579 RepID=A0A428N5D0_9BACI|nr:spore gernimation protein [Salibacterium salarium]